MRQDDVVYPGLPGGSRGRLYPQRPSFDFAHLPVLPAPVPRRQVQAGRASAGRTSPGFTFLTTNISGTLVAETRYLPYGEERWITGALVTDFTFMGQRADSYIKLMEMGARWNDPWLAIHQRGVRSLPAGDTVAPETENPQDWNHYTYAPTREMRPLGGRSV